MIYTEIPHQMWCKQDQSAPLPLSELPVRLVSGGWFQESLSWLCVGLKQVQFLTEPELNQISSKLTSAPCGYESGAVHGQLRSVKC